MRLEDKGPSRAVTYIGRFERRDWEWVEPPRARRTRFWDSGLRSPKGIDGMLEHLRSAIDPVFGTAGGVGDDRCAEVLGSWLMRFGLSGFF